ncbi:MAG: DUF2914 domain-containing protein [Candidatus Saganbacteria bacterium]|nr:DUF2914 domain-containing protein [Candidatus Saganbacteria bacterium]
MVRFAGYARKRQPKWPYALIAVTILLSLIVIIFIASAVTGWLESEINKPVVTTTTTTTTTTTVSSTTTTTAAAATTSTTVTSPTAQAAPGGAGGASVSRIVVASGLGDDRLPVDDLTEASASGHPTLYCYIRYRCDSPPQTVRHVWLAPGGKTAAEIELTLKNQSGATWSYIDIAGLPVGEWAVEARAADGTVLARRPFKTY